jgi:hypothetical protein
MNSIFDVMKNASRNITIYEVYEGEQYLGVVAARDEQEALKFANRLAADPVKVVVKEAQL